MGGRQLPRVSAESMGPLGRLALTCYRRRRWVLVLWAAGAAVVIFLGVRYSAPWDNSFAGGKTESQQVQDLIQRHFPQQTGTR